MNIQSNVPIFHFHRRFCSPSVRHHKRREPKESIITGNKHIYLLCVYMHTLTWKNLGQSKYKIIRLQKQNAEKLFYGHKRFERRCIHKHYLPYNEIMT